MIVCRHCLEAIESHEGNQIQRKLNCIDDDIVDIQDELFEEVSIEELEEMEDDYKEISCKNCGKPIYIENSTLQKENKIPCPYCGENIK